MGDSFNPCSEVEMKRIVFAALALLLSVLPAAAQQPAPVSSTLFQNVRVFDGKSGRLTAPSSVLVRGNTIARI